MVNVKAGFSALSQAFYDEVGRPNLIRFSNDGTAFPVALPEISTTSIPTILPYGSTQHLHQDATDVPPARTPPILPYGSTQHPNADATDVAPARGRPVVPAGSSSDDVSLEQEQRPSRSTLVNVKEGLYAIRPALYEPVGEAQPVDTGSLTTATAAIRNPNALMLAKQKGAAGQHAHAEFGCRTVGAEHHKVENPPIDVGNEFGLDSRPLESVASSSSTFIQVSQL